MYRFALIGQTSSGKTCYMATLALNMAHPGGLTAQLKRDLTGDRRDDGTAPGPTADGRSFVDDAAAERKGFEWITKATRALGQGRLPPPNDPDRYLVDFRIGSEDRGVTDIRMVDYAGEFINQELDGSDDRTALFRHLQQCDGLLVVAEFVPAEAADADRRVVIERIGRVSDFFGSLHDSCKGHLGTAIAVVLTKWDQHSTIDFDRPDAENAKVRGYLRRSLVHQALVSRVRNLLVEQVEVASDLPLGIQFGNCAVFPASAFGRCVRDESGTVLPDMDSRQPFGLIEPLLWLASRYEEINAAGIESDWRKSVLARIWPMSAGRIVRRCSSLMETVPRKAATARRLRVVRDAAWFAATTATAAWLLLAAGVADSARSLSRNVQWESYMAIAANPATDDESLVRVRDFFQSWSTTSWPGLLSQVLPPTKDGKAQAAKIDSIRINRFGERLDEAIRANDPALIVSAAKDYLDRLPNGPRAGEAAVIVEEENDRLARVALQERIKHYDGRIDSLDDLQDLLKIKEDLAGLRRQAKEGDKTLDADYRTVVDRVARREQILREKQRHLALQEAVSGALARGDFLQASGAIAATNVQDDFWEGMVTQFAAQVPTRLESLLKDLVSRENFATAATSADDAKKALRAVEAAVPLARASLRKSVTDASPRVLDIRRHSLDEPYDRHLYRQVLQVKNEANCTRYLTVAPIGGMKGVVQDYREYLESSLRPVEIRVTPRLKWGDITGDVSPNYEIRWTLWADGRNVAHQNEIVMETVVGKDTTLGEAVAINAEGLDRAIAIKLELLELDAGTDPDDIGLFEGRITPRDMLESKHYVVKGKEVIAQHELYFTGLQGYRREPSLPPWHP